jgi:conjugal transfer pilin signal peptidase TrbI
MRIAAAAPICILPLLLAAYSGFGLRINASSSLPHALYLSLPARSLKRNQIISFSMPQSRVAFAKIVAGLPGDTIEIRDQTLYINGDKKGAIVSNFKAISSQVIPEGFFFALGASPVSFDSRYEDFGLVPQESIQKELWPIF